MNLSKQQAMILFGVIVLVIIVGVVVFLNLRPTQTPPDAIKLNVWGTDSRSIMEGFVASYPYAAVKYTEVPAADYESKLLSALAAGTGPDVFMIGNRSLAKFKNIIAPLPTSSTFGILQLSQLYPDVVAADFTADEQIYGLPLSLDTMVMAYNKDLFNSAGIAVPPTTWNEFDTAVTRLRTLSSGGQISRAAAAIGGSTASIPNATDILALLMLQNGTEMPKFVSSAGAGATSPGLAAFNFYLQFANAASPYYTWNDGMGTAIDNFAAGKAAIIFVYQSDLTTIKAKAPFLNYGIAAMPQAAGATVSVNYPKYSSLVASKAGQWPAAWSFIIYEAAQGGSKAYLSATGKPPVLRSDIAASMNDPKLSVFASQTLTARSWYQADDTKIDGILNTAIKNVLNGAADATRALREAEIAIGQLSR